MLRFKYEDKNQEFYRNPISALDFDTNVLVEREDSLKLTKGDLKFQNLCQDGYRIASSVLTQAGPFTYSVENNLDVVKLYFNRKGTTHVGYQQFKKQFIVGERQSMMLYSPELLTSMSHTGSVSEIFSLQFTKQRFYQFADHAAMAMQQFAEAIAGDKPFLFSDHWQPTDFRIEQCINDILHCPVRHDLRTLYLHSKATELFVLFADAFSTQKEKSKSFISRSVDKEKLFFARDYILKNYMEPLSLKAVSKACQLNEYKLKRGFKELFGTSVIDFVITQRLQQANHLLRDGQLSISEVAYKVGYASPNYFTKAFQNKFGSKPSTLRQS